MLYVKNWFPGVRYDLRRRGGGLDRISGRQDDNFIQIRNCPTYCSGFGWCDAEGVCHVRKGNRNQNLIVRTSIQRQQNDVRTVVSSVDTTPLQRQLPEPELSTQSRIVTRTIQSEIGPSRTRQESGQPIVPPTPSPATPPPDYKNLPHLCRGPDFQCMDFVLPQASKSCGGVTCQVCNYKGQCVRSEEDELAEFCNQCKTEKSGWCNKDRQCVMKKKWSKSQ